MEHVRQPVSEPELAAIPLGNVTSAMKFHCATLSQVPALVMKGTNSQTCWICACKITAESSSSIFLCHPLDIQKQIQIDSWVHFPSFPHSTGISSSWRKPPPCWEQETFSWGHRRYSARTKTNSLLNTRPLENPSLYLNNT